MCVMFQLSLVHVSVIISICKHDIIYHDISINYFMFVFQLIFFCISLSLFVLKPYCLKQTFLSSNLSIFVEVQKVILQWDYQKNIT